MNAQRINEALREEGQGVHLRAIGEGWAVYWIEGVNRYLVKLTRAVEIKGRTRGEGLERVQDVWTNRLQIAWEVIEAAGIEGPGAERGPTEGEQLTLSMEA
jgi:hypothetical protein